MSTRLLLSSMLLIAGFSSISTANAESIKATLTGINCDSDYCQLQYELDNKPQQAVCADGVYCEEWTEAEKLPASVQNKPATLHLKREKIGDDKTESTMVYKIEL